MAPLDLPLAPMLARAADRIPEGLVYEPKWDGWRCLLARDGADIRLWSRRGTDLTAFFPELVAAAAELPERCVLDGEVVIAAGNRLEYTLLATRHASRADAERLARRHPATFIAFDLLALDDHSLLRQPWRARRELLTVVLDDHPRALAISPVTTDVEVAERWFDRFEGAGLDGVMAKHPDGPYEPGQRTWLKIKHRRTVDVVVGSFRLDRNSTPTHPQLGSLQLGLFDADDRLWFMGVCSGFANRQRRELAEVLGQLELERGTDAWAGHPWSPTSSRGARVPDHVTRWNAPRDEVHLIAPMLVAEVSYDYVHDTDGPARFRSNADFLRWRPEREPESCRFEQLELTCAVDLADVLEGELP